MKTKEEIKELPAAELREQVLLSKQDLFGLRLQRGAGLEKPHRIKELRRQIARLETRLTELRNQETAANAG